MKYKFYKKYNNVDAMWYVFRLPAAGTLTIGRCMDEATADTVLATLLIGANLKQVVYLHYHKKCKTPTLVLRKRYEQPRQK